MATIKLGVIVAAIRGKVGGVVFARTRAGAVARTFTQPINPQSAAQVAARQRLSAANTAWAGLTAAQRIAWATYGENVPVMNKVGEVIHNTGQNWFIGSATARLEAGLAIVSDGPLIFERPADVEVTTSALGAGSGTVDVAFDNTEDWANETGAALSVFASRQIPETRNFFKGPFQSAGAILGDDTTPPTSPETMTSPFVYTGSVGAVLGRLRTTVLLADGRFSAGTIVNIVQG